jgi:hypothetical protein
MAVEGLLGLRGIKKKKHTLFRWKKVGLFAHRINDSLSVGEGSLNVGDDRINDRIYDLAPAPINRSTESMTESMAGWRIPTT